MEYPRNVYLVTSGRIDYVSVPDEAEHAAAIAGGWFDTVPEAIEGKPKESAKEPEKVEAKESPDLPEDAPKRRGRPPKA